MHMHLHYLPLLDFVARNDSGLILTPCLGASSEFAVIKARLEVKSAAARHGGSLIPCVNVDLRKIDVKDIVDLGTLDTSPITRRKLSIAEKRITVATLTCLVEDPLARLADIARRLDMTRETSALIDSGRVFSWDEKEYMRKAMSRLLAGHSPAA